MDDQQPLWTGDRRRDGLHIVLTEHGFSIVPRDRSRSVTFCPCCGNTFKSAHAAREIADHYFPPADGNNR